MKNKIEHLKLVQEVINIVGILAVLACKLGQVEVNVGVGERATSDKWCQSGLIEFNGAW